MKTACSLLILMLGAFALEGSNVNVDPQKEDENLQHEQPQWVQPKKDLQQEQTDDFQYKEDLNLKHEQTNDLQYREDLNLKQEKALNRIF